MEIPETDIDELSELLAGKVQIQEDSIEEVIELLKGRVDNLNQDIVVKQRQRFELLEDKVKTMLEKKALSDGNNQVTTKQLKQIMSDTEESIANDVGNSKGAKS